MHAVILEDTLQHTLQHTFAHVHTHTWTALRVASLLHYVGVVAVARGAVA